MKSILLLMSALVCAGSVFAAPETSMSVSSNEFSNGGTIPPRFTCEGANDSPSLRIALIPDNAKSLVLVMEDPDAVKGTFTHWLVWGIAPDAADPCGYTRRRRRGDRDLRPVRA